MAQPVKYIEMSAVIRFWYLKGNNVKEIYNELIDLGYKIQKIILENCILVFKY